MIEIAKTSRLADAVLAKGMLAGLENFYPDIGYWYVNQCMPGIILGTDSLIVAKEHGQIVGIALGKKRDGETKVRCLRVAPSHQKGLTAARLMECMLRELGTDKPYCTVSEEMLHQFSRLFINLFSFDLSRVDKGMYRRNKLEYVFNEPRTPLN